MAKKVCILAFFAICLMVMPLVAQRGGRAGFGGSHRGGFGHSGFVRGGVGFGLGFGFAPRYVYPRRYYSSVYIGGYWGAPYGYYPYYGDYSYYAPQPPVVIVQQSAPPPAQVYYAPRREAAAQPAERPLTLLVFNDHTIHLAREYWVEGDRLHYVTNYGAANNVALASLDIAYTRQLNQERHVGFDLTR